MNIPENDTTRKKFIWWGLSAMAVFTSLRYWIKPASFRQPDTIKMLTRDGMLVEVDAQMLQGKKSKIQDEDIHNWVKKETNHKK